MQTFSNLRRDSTFKRYLLNIAIFLVLYIYLFFTSIYQVLTPLFGIMFLFIIYNFKNKKLLFPVILAFIYMFLFEIEKGMFLFSFVFFFLFYYHFLFFRMKKFFFNRNYMIVLMVSVAYFGYYLFNIFISYLFNFDPLTFFAGIFLYIICDCIIAIFLY